MTCVRESERVSGGLGSKLSCEKCLGRSESEAGQRAGHMGKGVERGRHVPGVRAPGTLSRAWLPQAGSRQEYEMWGLVMAQVASLHNSINFIIQRNPRGLVPLLFTQ